MAMDKLLRSSLAAAAVAVVLTSCQQTPPTITPPIVTVSISPTSATLEPGEEQEFTATVSGTSDTAVDWTATCGDIVGTGSTVTYVAPGSEADCTVRVSSAARPAASASALVEVRERALESSTDPDDPVADLELAAGETVVFRVNVPSDQRGTDRRLVIEVDDDEGVRQLDLVLLDPNGATATASTSGTAFFQPGRQGVGEGFIGTRLTAADARLRADVVDRAVSIIAECFGPCISRPAPGDLTHVYVEVTNVGGGSETVPFYAYTQPYLDEAEPANDSPAGAVDVSTGQPFRGAIEVIGDEDWVYFADPGTVTLTQREDYDLNIRMQVVDEDGFIVDTILPGQSATVFTGDFGVIEHDPAQPTRASVYGYYDVAYVND
jgi:hypothetical protein